MKYLLDFDHTLLDTERLKEQTALDGHLELAGTPEFWEHYSVCDFLFPDVFPWLLEKPKTSLHMLTAFKPSQGPQAKAFQEAKCTSDGFAHRFASVTVMEGEKGAAAVEIAAQFPPHEPIVFVDDRLEQCLSVKHHAPQIECFLMVRTRVVPQAVPPEIHVVYELKDVDAIMKSL